MDSEQVTGLLKRWSGGDDEALDRLVPVVYDDLRRMAHRQLLNERGDHTLSTTGLVHESFLGLVGQEGTDWRDRAHFFAIASRAMRHVLIDYARRRSARKRGGDRVRVPLEPGMAARREPVEDLLAVEEALSRLEEKDPRLARVVECRFFGGMTVEETACALDSSVRTVERDWTRAKAYLNRLLTEG